VLSDSIEFIGAVQINLSVYLSIYLSNPNVLVASSKGMWAVKLCTNKILQFLTGGAG